jgi:dynein heavy chain, axonemal
MENNPE